jgi:hypothetical protein
VKELPRERHCRNTFGIRQGDMDSCCKINLHFKIEPQRSREIRTQQKPRKHKNRKTTEIQQRKNSKNITKAAVEMEAGGWEARAGHAPARAVRLEALEAAGRSGEDEECDGEARRWGGVAEDTRSGFQKPRSSLQNSPECRPAAGNGAHTEDGGT